ncbi:terminal protein [Streptomyces sp. KS 21]|nr:terminal protein [Streptomyces sp. KS 21]TDU80656.1 hypothetical protein EDD91_7551 [Streptomyces sp. KS 21]
MIRSNRITCPAAGQGRRQDGGQRAQGLLVEFTDIDYIDIAY